MAHIELSDEGIIWVKDDEDDEPECSAELNDQISFISGLNI